MAAYVGKYEADAPAHRGWIVGTFMEDGPRHTEDVEVKYWSFEPGPTDHPAKTSATLECTFILTGKTEAIIDGQTTILNAGDYVVIEPGTPNNLVATILEPTTGLTIKAPSDPSAKLVIKEESNA